MVDVLLTHSYHLYYDHKQVRKMQPYPPLGTLYAAALLRQHGYSVAVFDTMLEDPETGFPAALRRHHPKVVAVVEDNFNFLSKMCLTRMRQACFGMIEASRAAGARVVVNGPDASDHVRDYLSQGADYAVLGEAEWTLLELVESLLKPNGRTPRDIPGLAYVFPGSGELVKTARRPLMKDVDSLPPPARDLIDLGRYRDAWKLAHGYFSLNAVASRGCPYQCNWCAKPIYGNSLHVRSAERVAEEMKELKQAHGAEHIWFADDIFGLKPRWMPDLARHVERLDAAVPFKMQSRVNFMTEENVSALRRAGCAEVWMGVESGSQKILDSMDKGTRVEEIAAARLALRQHGIRACYFLQFGYPGEAWEDIQKTVRLVRETRPDDIGVSVSYPLPGTKFYERVRAELGEKKNWVDSDDLAMMFKGAYGNEFYRALRNALHAEVDAWNTSGVSGTDADLAASLVSEDLAARWAMVEEMEKTCRNAEPTFAPVLACADVAV